MTFLPSGLHKLINALGWSATTSYNQTYNTATYTFKQGKLEYRATLDLASFEDTYTLLEGLGESLVTSLNSYRDAGTLTDTSQDYLLLYDLFTLITDYLAG
jgi:hypothetical protein